MFCQSYKAEASVEKKSVKNICFSREGLEARRRAYLGLSDEQRNEFAAMVPIVQEPSTLALTPAILDKPKVDQAVLALLNPVEAFPGCGTQPHLVSVSTCGEFVNNE
jgi:hypothetical protein